MNPAAAANVGLRRAAGPLRLAEGGGYLPVERDHRHHRAAAICTRTRCIAATAATSRCPPTLCGTLATMPCWRVWRAWTARATATCRNPPQWYIRDLHTNACGDFLLMSRTMWRTVRGFPLDNTVLSLDCDSLIMHAAVALGSHEIRLPPSCRIFKGRHERLFTNRISYVWTPLAVQGRQGHDQFPLVAAADRSPAAPSTIPSARSPAWKACWRRRSSAISSSPPSNGRTASVPQLNQPENWGLARSAARGKAAVPGALVDDRTPRRRHERRAGRLPRRRPRQPVARR